MAAIFNPSEKFQFDKLTTEILHDLVERAQDDTLTWDAVIFRRDYGKHLSVLDQLVTNGFIVHDRERNTYRLHLPFFRLLEGVHVASLLADINSLMNACRNHYLTWFDDPVTIKRLSEQSELGFERVKILSRYLQWAGLLAIPRGGLDSDSRLLVNEYILEPSCIEDWMDKQLQIFDVSKNNLGSESTTPAYSTPMLGLLGETIQRFYTDRRRSTHPEKDELVTWLREKSVGGKKVSKVLAESFFQILNAPERRRVPQEEEREDKHVAKAKKTPVKKRVAKKTTSKKVVTKKATVKKKPVARKKTATKKAVAKRPLSKKVTSKKVASSKKTVAKKTSAKVSARKKSATKK